jgi:hypothetical protein
VKVRGAEATAIRTVAALARAGERRAAHRAGPRHTATTCRKHSTEVTCWHLSIHICNILDSATDDKMRSCRWIKQSTHRMNGATAKRRSGRSAWRQRKTIAVRGGNRTRDVHIRFLSSLSIRRKWNRITFLGARVAPPSERVPWRFRSSAVATIQATAGAGRLGMGRRDPGDRSGCAA